MSFILDALKKSESDRQRQNGPALFEVRVAPPRTRLPLWAIAIALLLVVNLGVALWMLLRHQGHAVAPAAAPPTAAASAPMLPGATPLPVVAASAPAPPSAAPPAAVPGTSSAAAPPAAAQAAPAAAPNTTADAGESSGAPETANAEDYAPAQEQPASGIGSHVRRGTASGVPLYQELTTVPGAQIPQLRLDLHVFAARPEDRFVLINMHKLREGDTLPEGVRVDSITPEGAVLTFNGSKFLLPRE